MEQSAPLRAHRGVVEHVDDEGDYPEAINNEVDADEGGVMDGDDDNSDDNHPRCSRSPSNAPRDHISSEGTPPLQQTT